MGKLEWIPMESNPEVVNSFLRTVGIKPHLKVVDVLGFEDELLQMVEGTVEGLLLLYPLTNNSEECPVDTSASRKLYFMRQTIANACATMALIHMIANRCDEDKDFEPDSTIRKFIVESKQLEPQVKADKFESCQTIATAHEKATNEGQTEPPSASESVEYHFISIIYKDDTIYEMDGRKEAPVNHGKTTAETFLKDGMKVCEKFFKHNPSNPNFSIIAFVRDE